MEWVVHLVCHLVMMNVWVCKLMVKEMRIDVIVNLHVTLDSIVGGRTTLTRSEGFGGEGCFVTLNIQTASGSKA